MAEGRRSRDEPVPEVHCNDVRESAAEVHEINVDNLPDEIMVNIFSYFSLNELIDVLQNVCTRWKHLVHDPVLWLNKEFIIAGPYGCKGCCLDECSKSVHCRCEETNEGILRTAPMMPQLRKLTIARGIEDRVLREACTNWPNLTDLRICSMQLLDYSLMKNVFEKCPKIKKLRMWCGLLTVRRCAELLSSLEHLRSVEVFRDNHNQLSEETHIWELSPVRLRVLGDGCPWLEEIHLDCDYNSLDVNDLEYFFRARRHSLTVAKVPWMTKTVCMVPLLKQCGTSLRKLCLHNFRVPPELEAVAFKAVGELHSLEELVISMVFLWQPQVMALAFQPGCLTQLRRLHLGFKSRVWDETVIAVSRGCPNLRELKIDFSDEITDTALTEIHHLKHLEILDLSGCNKLGGMAMAYIVQLPSLHTLVLRWFRDMGRLQPSLQQIVNMTQLRCLDILESKHNGAVPFSEFPGRLVKLSKLCVTHEDFVPPNHNMAENFFTELRHKMPHLRICNNHSSRRRHLTQLQRLHLGFKSSVMTETVVAVSRSCPNLRELRIDLSEEITDTALTEIHHLKHLEILALYGCNGLGGMAISYVAQLPALHTLALRSFRDLSRLQPSLQQIVNKTELRCLDILESKHNVAVPFDEFPGRLVKLSELRVTYEDFAAPNHNLPENFFIELHRKMPHLRIYNSRRK